jgi:hypothetical protein
LLYDCNATRDIYLVFQDDVNYLLSRFFKEGFKHCFAIERQALGWVCIDASRYNCMATILPAAYNDMVIEHYVQQNPAATVVHLSIKMDDLRRTTYPRLGSISCVGMMQYIIGTYWPLTLTPYKLYNKLVNNLHDKIKVVKIWRPQPPPPAAWPREPEELSL